jgi:predicted DNA-binding protein with PD1-like motif
MDPQWHGICCLFWSMKSRLVYQDGSHHRTFVLALEKAEDPVPLLARFADHQQLCGSHIHAIGGFERAVVGYFDRLEQDYVQIPIGQQVEVLSLLGDVAHHHGKPVVHLHAVLGLRDGSTRGGHLLSASVWPTLEVILTEWPRHLRKRFDPEVRLPIIDVDGSN